MATEINSTNAQLKKLLKSYVTEYREACDRSRQEYMKNLPVGQPIPAEGVIYGKENREKFQASCSDKRQKAFDLISAERDKVKAKMSEAPSVDAVNTISLLKLRNNVRSGEIESMLEKYGDNEQARAALLDIANQNNIRDLDTAGTKTASERIEELDGLSRNFSQHFNIYKAEKEDLAKYEGSSMFMANIIDQVFPED